MRYHAKPETGRLMHGGLPLQSKQGQQKAVNCCGGNRHAGPQDAPRSAGVVGDDVRALYILRGFCKRVLQVLPRAVPR